MSKPLNRAVRVALCSVAGALALAAGGCDNPQSEADRDVQKKLKEVAGAPTTQARYKLLEEAAKNKEASQPARIAGSAALGAARYSSAVERMGELDAKEREALSYVRQIETLVAQVASNNVSVGGLTGSNPSAAAEMFQKNKAKFEKQASDADAAAKKATADIDGKKQEIAAAQQVQQKATDEAADLLTKSEAAQGQQSVDLFAKSADLRAQSAKAAHDVSTKQRELAALEVALQEAQKLKAVSEEGVARAVEQMEKLSTGWKGTEQTIAQRQQGSAALAASVADLAKKLAAAISDAAAIRGEVDQELEGAVNAFTEAAKIATTYTAELTKMSTDPANENNPQKVAWQTLKTQHDPLHFKLPQGRAELQRGIIHLNHKLLLAAVNGLNLNMVTPAYSGAKLTPPAELSSSATTATVEAATKEADAHLQPAIELLGDVADRAAPAEKLEAGSLHMTAQYAAFALTDKKANLDAARERLKAMDPKENLIPKLPENLEGGIVIRTAAPPRVAPPRPPVTQPVTPPTPVEGAGNTPSNP